MKTKTLFFAALALIAVSCTNTEIVEDNLQDAPKSISFSAYANKLTRVAQTDVTTDNLSKFNVTAIGNGEVYINLNSATL